MLSSAQSPGACLEDQIWWVLTGSGTVLESRERERERALLLSTLRLRSLLMLSRAERLGWSPTVWTAGLTNISSDIIRGTSGVMTTFSHNTQLLWQRQLNLDSVINYCILTVYFTIWIFILWDLQSIILMWIFLSLPRYFKLDCR